MKLLRYGPKGQEKPGLLDAEGRIRSLAGVVGDIAGPVLGRAGLARLQEVEIPACRSSMARRDLAPASVESANSSALA